jgi:hypothetical protein
MSKKQIGFILFSLTLLLTGLLLTAFPGCTDPEEKKVVEAVNTYLEGYRDLDPQKIKQTADISLIDIAQSDKQLIADLKARQEKFGWIKKWKIDSVTVDKVNHQSLQTVYLFTDREAMKTTFDLRTGGAREWRVIYIKVEDHISWSDWPKSLGRLVMGHSNVTFFPHF